MQQDASGGCAHEPHATPPTPQDFESDVLDVYEVACIVGHKIENYVDMYRVHWVGFSHTQDTWEPQDHLTGCKDLLQEYKAHNHNLIAHRRILAQQHGNLHVCMMKRKHAC